MRRMPGPTLALIVRSPAYGLVLHLAVHQHKGNTMSKRRTITLTDRSPIQIIESRWPVIASASGDNYQGLDASHPVSCGCCDRWFIRVRRHRDGRVIVYGIYAVGEFSGSGYAGPGKAGQLLAAGDDVVAAVRRVVRTLGLPTRTITDCVARLPVERI